MIRSMEIWLFITCYILISSDIVHTVHMYIILSVASLHNSLLHYNVHVLCTNLTLYNCIHLFYQLLHDIIRKICFVNVNLNIYLKTVIFYVVLLQCLSDHNHNLKAINVIITFLLQAPLIY